MSPPLRMGVIAFLLLTLLVLVPDAVAQRLPLRTYTSADGLAGDHITALLADSRGFLWIGTATGLSRFDGREFRTYGLGDGLPDAAVNALLEDRDGVLWVATKGGLACIDPQGHDIARVPLDDDPAPAVLHLLQTRDGRIWVAAQRALYVIATPGRRGPSVRVPLVLPTTPPPEIAELWGIEGLAEGREGDLWIGTGWGLLRRLPDGRMIPIRVHPTAKDDRVYHLAVDGEGRLWITHWGIAHLPGIHFGVYVLAPEPVAQATARAERPLHDRARRITAAHEFTLPQRPGEVIYATAGGPFGDARIHAIYSSDAGVVWIATEDGLIRVDATRGSAPAARTTRYGAQNGLGLPIKRLARDAHRNLWLGTRGVGLLRFEIDGVVTYTAPNGSPLGEIDSVIEDAAGSICTMGLDTDGQTWFGAIGAAAIGTADAAGAPRAGAGVESDRFVRFMPRGTAHVRYWGWGWHHGLLQDRAGEWWVPSGEGLFRYPAASSCTSIATARPIAVYGRAQGLPSDEIFRLFEDSRGDLWLSVGASPVRWRRATDSFEVMSPEANPPTAFAEDRAGNIWIGFYNGGLARWQPRDRRGGSGSGSGTLHRFDAKDGVPGGFVDTLLVDAQGRLWIGAYGGGLARIDDPTAARPVFGRPIQETGLVDTAIYKAIEDRQQHLFVATARGILRFDPALTRARRFSMTDGLPTHQVRTVYLDRRGQVWFGTQRGLSRLSPRAEEAPAPPPPIFIDSLRVDGVPERLSQLGALTVGDLEVEAGARRLEIGYGSPSLAPGDTPRYQVRLHGADPDWGPATSNRTALYLRLAPGTYRFEARAVGSNGTVSARAASVTFRILPPIWQRRWFQAAIVLMVAAAGYAAYRSRVNRLLALERVRSRIATDLHDDLGARLSRISILSEVAARRITTDAASAERLLGEVGETARSLIEATADITWSVDPRQDDLASLTARIRRFAADMLDARDIAWTFDAPADGARLTLAPEHRRHVLLVFQEAINNVVRHSRAQRVTLTLRIDGRRLDASIDDDGCGFETREAGHGPAANAGNAGNGSSADDAAAFAGRGLGNMATRARELGGTLTLTSAAGKGTRVHVRVPL